MNKINNKQENEQVPPIVLLYIYSKIKKRVKGNIIKTRLLKEIIKKTIISKEGIGGDRTGIPKIYIYDVIKDMVNFSLIKRIDCGRYNINTSYEINNPLLKINNFLEKSRTSPEFKGKINNLLKEFLEKISSEEEYEIIKNKHLSKLKKFPY